jgi:ankyrin repeat protein
VEYESYNRDTDDAATEVGETKSVNSEATLLGVQEEKVKDKEYDIYVAESEVQEVKQKAFLCGLFGGFRYSSKAKPAISEKTTTEPPKVKTLAFRKLVSAFTPARIKAKRETNHKDKVEDLMQAMYRAAVTEKTLYTNTTLLNNSLAHEVITKTRLIGCAATSGDVTFVNFLLARGAPVDGPDIKHTPLGHAIMKSDEEMCRVLLRAGAKLVAEVGRNATTQLFDLAGGESGETALKMAITEKNPVIVGLLLEHGAWEYERQLAGEDDETSLHLVAMEGAENVLKPFFEYTAPRMCINTPGGSKLNTPLHLAVQSGDLPTVKLLVEAGANLEARNIRLCTPLHWAIKHNKSDIATYLIAHGADIEAARVRLETPLKYAICQGNQTITQTLLAAGAKPNKPTCEKKSPLHSAAAHGSVAIVQNLLDAGADVNVRSAYGSTPLYLAAQNGRIASAQLLLKNGADRKMGRTSFGSTKERGPANIAKKNGNWEVVRLLECWEQGKEFVAEKENGKSHQLMRIFWRGF